MEQRRELVDQWLLFTHAALLANGKVCDYLRTQRDETRNRLWVQLVSAKPPLVQTHHQREIGSCGVTAQKNTFGGPSIILNIFKRPRNCGSGILNKFRGLRGGTQTIIHSDDGHTALVKICGDGPRNNPINAIRMLKYRSEYMRLSIPAFFGRASFCLQKRLSEKAYNDLPPASPDRGFGCETDERHPAARDAWSVNMALPSAASYAKIIGSARRVKEPSARVLPLPASRGASSRSPA